MFAYFTDNMNFKTSVQYNVLKITFEARGPPRGRIELPVNSNKGRTKEYE